MKYISLFTILIFVLGCEDKNFNEPETHPEISMELYNTEEKALSALDAIYHVLRDHEKIGRFEMLGNYCSPYGHYTGEPGGNDAPYQSTLQKFLHSNLPYEPRGITTYWEELYNGIKLCNQMLYALNTPEVADDFDEKVKDRIMGETFFLRGLFEFKLLVIFAGMPQLQQDFNGQLLGLPFNDQINLDSGFNSPRPALLESWERVIKDFQNAVDYLPQRSELSFDEIGRATKGAAHAMLTKTNLYMENWHGALEYAQLVINSGEYWLEGEQGYEQSYSITRTSANGMVDVSVSALKWIFQPEGEDHGGVIFSVLYNADHSRQFPDNYEGSLLPMEFGPRAIERWDSDEKGLTTETLFWGLYQPTPYFVGTAYKNAGGSDTEGNIKDPRYFYTIITSNDSLPYYYANEELRMKYPDSVKFDAWHQWPGTGLSQWKYFADPLFQLEAVGYADYPHDYQAIRFADILLMAAEAAYHVGDLSSALTYTNRVRSRARNCGNTTFPSNLTSINLDDIYSERIVELAMEGHAFFDLVRTRRIKSALMHATASEYNIVSHPKYDLTYATQAGENFIVGQHEIFPIPPIIIESSKGVLTQNPGYSYK